MEVVVADDADLWTPLPATPSSSSLNRVPLVDERKSPNLDIIDCDVQGMIMIMMIMKSIKNDYKKSV